MAMTQLKPPGNIGAQNSPQSDNFAKALLEAGGHAVQSTMETGVDMMSDALGSLIGSGSSHSTAQQNEQDQTQNLDTSSGNPFSKVNQGEQPWNQEDQNHEWKRREMRILRHREIQQTEVFDARQVETDRKIAQLTNELEALAKDLDDTNRKAREAQIAVMQNTVSPGDYHIGMLEKLLKVVMILRQSVGESASWLDMFNGRHAAQQSYWGQFHSQGTQWSMSSERAIATSVG
jgi:hypothetical protein